MELSTLVGNVCVQADATASRMVASFLQSHGRELTSCVAEAVRQFLAEVRALRQTAVVMGADMTVLYAIDVAVHGAIDEALRSPELGVVVWGAFVHSLVRQ